MHVGGGAAVVAAGGHGFDGGVWAAAALIGDDHRGVIRAMEARRAELALARRRLAQDIRNNERKRQRLIVRAQGISDADLLAIVAVRAAAKAKAAAAKGKAKAAPKAKGKAKAKAKGKGGGKGVADGGDE